MSKYYRGKVETKTLAIGIKGDLNSLCGAVKHFERHGRQWNGLLTLKERCARRIALIKNEQLKCFITAYLPPTLFKYVTKDIFDLQRSEFTSNYAKTLDVCQDCAMKADTDSRIICQCANLEAAIDKLNKYVVKRINKRIKTKTNQLKIFELIYKMPNDEDYWDYEGVYLYDDDEPISFFLYLSPCEYQDKIESDHMDGIPYQVYSFINGQVSVEQKLLFVDAMRFFGGFQTDNEQPQLILSDSGDIQR
jgi:hypothetical protein